MITVNGIPVTELQVGMMIGALLALVAVWVLMLAAITLLKVRT